MAPSGVIKSALFLTLLGAWCCFSTQFSVEWNINMKYTPSSSSRFYVLNNWQDTFAKTEDVSTPLPAAKISDIMLKTMGILRDGATWPGVQMWNIFNRPLATALFLVDGLSPESSLTDLSSNSFKVDQTGLTGCTNRDSLLLFQGDSVAEHLNDLFDAMSHTTSVCANTAAAQVSSANGAHTVEEQLTSLVADIQADKLSLSKYGLDTAAAKLEATNKVDAKFFAEIILIKDAIEQLKELPNYVTDHSPDVFIFTVSTLESMEKRYGAGSSKMGVAIELVKQVMRESSDILVSLYQGRVLVQALVLQWNHPAMDKSAPELEEAYALLLPYLHQQDRVSFLAALPGLSLKEHYYHNFHLCKSLKDVLGKGTKMYAHCATPDEWEEQNAIDSIQSDQTRRRRYAAENDEDTSNITLANNITVLFLAESRSNQFSGIFLIVLFIVLSMALSLYAVSWALWNMDPGKDSIIYRQVSDPTVRMQ